MYQIDNNNNHRHKEQLFEIMRGIALYLMDIFKQRSSHSNWNPPGIDACLSYLAETCCHLMLNQPSKENINCFSIFLSLKLKYRVNLFTGVNNFIRKLLSQFIFDDTSLRNLYSTVVLSCQKLIEEVILIYATNENSQLLAKVIKRK